VNKLGKKKAVFLAGGPGSGKSFVASLKISGVSLKKLGFKAINSDDDFEAALHHSSIKMTPENIFSTQGQKIRERTKRYTAEKLRRAQSSRLGLVIDGTGKDVAKIRKQKKQLEELGYTTWMVFVETSLSVALRRNRMRPRSLPDNEVEIFWHQVMKNKPKFYTQFGSNMHTIRNETIKEVKTQFEAFLKHILKSKMKPSRCV